MHVPNQTDISVTRRNITTFFLSLGGFCLGTTEFVAMGLLDLIGDSFNKPASSASAIITAYALGVVIGAPLITVWSARIARRKLVLLLILAIAFGNGLTVISGLTGNFPLIVDFRFIAGMPHGAYFSVATLIAASMAPQGQRGRAIARASIGLAIATVIGVPAAQWLGEKLGWNYAFALVTVLGLITFVGLYCTVPNMNRMKLVDPRTELSAVKNPQILLTLAIGIVGFGGMFAIYTCISYIMKNKAGMSPEFLWVVLMIYGIGMILGTYMGGWISDRNLEKGICGTLLAITVAMFIFLVASNYVWPGALAFGLIGFLGSTLTPNLQTRLMDVAGEAQTLAAASNHSALNAANAAGAFLGTHAMDAWGYDAPPVVGAVLAVLGIGVWFIAYSLRMKTEHQQHVNA